MHYKYTVMQYVGGDIDFKPIGEYKTLKEACNALNKVERIKLNSLHLSNSIHCKTFDITFDTLGFIQVERIGKLPVEVELDNLFGCKE